MMIHIKITGRVQGVGFRAWACRRANALNLSGWVRNRINGQVEIMADGPDTVIETFLADCRRGPVWARVDKITPIGTPDAPVIPIAYGLFITQATV